MMRSALLATMVLLSTFGVATVSDSARARQDQAFLNDLAQPAGQLTARICSASELAAPAIARTCVGSFCLRDSDCASCPGGLSAWYCSSSHRCTPF
jgi:hypothetical protein